jgi:hypothetical protein
VSWQAWAIAALALVSLALGIFELVRAGGPYSVLEYDDGVWFGAALRLADGALPYRDFVLDQPPGVPLLLSPVALLAHIFGTAEALGVARYLTVLVEAANVVLVGRLVRHRSVLCVVVACAVAAVFPDAVITSRTVMLEPYCDLWCLLGLVAAFENGRATTSPRRALLAGAAFGVAGACKAFALLPFLVLLVWVSLPGPTGQGDRGQGDRGQGDRGQGREGRHQGARCLAGAAGAFALVCAPFVAMAPNGFFRQVVLTQLERGAPANPSLWGRLAQLLGVPPAPSMAGVPSPLQADLVFVVGALVLLALVLTWTSAAAAGRGSLARFGVVAAVVTAAGLAWPAAFYYHYAAFLAPFLALPVGLAAEALYAGRRRALVAAAAAALVVAGTTNAVRAVQTTDPPWHPDVTGLARAVPAGACAISDDPAVLILADRFTAPAGCNDLVDADGSTLSWSGGRRGDLALARPQANADWLAVLGQTGYIVLTQGLVPGRIPWGPALLSYLRGHFRPSATLPGLVVWARRSP